MARKTSQPDELTISMFSDFAIEAPENKKGDGDVYRSSAKTRASMLAKPAEVSDAQSLLDNIDEIEILKDIEPYPYQQKAIDRLLWAISKRNKKATRTACAVMATGTGKTFTLSLLARKVCREYGRKVLIIAPQIEIVEQWIETLIKLGMIPLLEQAENNAATKLGTVSDVVVVACQDTLTGNRLEQWPRDFFDLVIHDECDLALSPTWSAIIDYFTGRHIGVTATPDLADKRVNGVKTKRSIKDRFETLAFTYTITQAIKQGYLVRPIEKRAKNAAIDLTKLKVTYGDFNAKDLSEVIGANASALAEASIPLMGNRRTIAFTPTVFAALALAEAFKAFGITAIAISAKTPKKERKQIFKDFKAGKYQVLCNCSLVTRGVDIPCAECAIMARPTGSRALWVQMVGRILRSFYDEETGYRKTEAIIINFAWKFQKKQHKINVSPMELFNSNDVTEEVMDLAKAMYEKMIEDEPDREIDPEQIIQIAEEQIAEEIRNSVTFKLRNIKAQVTELDPLALELLEVPNKKFANVFTGQPVTLGQVQMLQQYGYEDATLENLDRRGASNLIDEAKRRRSLGLATWKQVKALIQCNVDYQEAREYSFEEAGAYLDANMSAQAWYKDVRTKKG